MNQDAINSVYMFIAELHGYKRGTVKDKIQHGKECYRTGALPEETPDDLHEIIWLQRLYKELESMFLYSELYGNLDGFHWEVPIELDASASMLGYIGCLLGDERLLTMTNMVGDENTLHDPWYVEGVYRTRVKIAATPMLYGSSKTPMELWDAKNLDYTVEDLQCMNRALRSGALGLANDMKDFVIRNANPKAEMEVHIWNDKFKIKCNHYKRVGDVHVAYDLYNTGSNTVRRIVHTKTKAVPDLERYRSYFQTLLIHCLDSQVADIVAGKCMEKYGFCIDIHDAFIVSPVAAADVRKWYAACMDEIFANRNEILTNYFRSIGITSAAQKQWEALQAKVEPVQIFQCRGEVLK